MPPVQAPPVGLSSAEAAKRLAEFGPNAVPEEQVSMMRRVLRHLWAANTLDA